MTTAATSHSPSSFNTNTYSYLLEIGLGMSTQPFTHSQQAHYDDKGRLLPFIETSGQKRERMMLLKKRRVANWINGNGESTMYNESNASSLSTPSSTPPSSPPAFRTYTIFEEDEDENIDSSSSSSVSSSPSTSPQTSIFLASIPRKPRRHSSEKRLEYTRPKSTRRKSLDSISEEEEEEESGA
ncbi:hypothetical protein ABKN59_002958 [Abortiporus biennis]